MMKGLASSRWRSRSDRRLAVESSSCGPERTARERPSAPKRREYARLASSQAYCKRDASSLSLPPRKRLVSPCASENAASPNPGADRMIKNHENLEWKVATVVENRSASISGKMRTLILSIKDDVRQFKGRRFGKIPSLERLENPRWIDAFTAPGQYMLVRCGGDDDFQQCGWTTEEARVCLSSTPYEAHNDSAFLSASIVQILVNREEGEIGGLDLGNFGPGDQFEVSEILGKGFQSFFHKENKLGASLEEGKNLILIGSGTGIGPLRSVLEWAPVQAYAGQHSVTLMYHVDALESAAYVDQFDEWRQAGIHIKPIVTSEDASILESELFDSQGKMRVKANNTHVLISGLPGKVTARLSRLLSQNAILGNQIFFCEY